MPSDSNRSQFDLCQEFHITKKKAGRNPHVTLTSVQTGARYRKYSADNQERGQTRSLRRTFTAHVNEKTSDFRWWINRNSFLIAAPLFVSMIKSSKTLLQ